MVEAHPNAPDPRVSPTFTGAPERGEETQLASTRYVDARNGRLFATHVGPFVKWGLTLGVLGLLVLAGWHLMWGRGFDVAYAWETGWSLVGGGLFLAILGLIWDR